MKNYKMLQAASLTAKYTDYQSFINEEEDENSIVKQEKVWVFTAEDLKNFMLAVSLLK